MLIMLLPWVRVNVVNVSNVPIVGPEPGVGEELTVEGKC